MYQQSLNTQWIQKIWFAGGGRECKVLVDLCIIHLRTTDMMPNWDHRWSLMAQGPGAQLQGKVFSHNKEAEVLLFSTIFLWTKHHHTVIDHDQNLKTLFFTLPRRMNSSNTSTNNSSTFKKKKRKKEEEV